MRSQKFKYQGLHSEILDAFSVLKMAKSFQWICRSRFIFLFVKIPICIPAEILWKLFCRIGHENAFEIIMHAVLYHLKTDFKYGNFSANMAINMWIHMSIPLFTWMVFKRLITISSYQENQVKWEGIICQNKLLSQTYLCIGFADKDSLLLHVNILSEMSYYLLS